MNVHFSSKTDEWATPEDVFAALDQEFNLNLDVCANELNAKKSEYFTKPFGRIFDAKTLKPLKPEDGLAQSWKGKRCWMNPPYSEISKWVEKAATGGAHTVVALLPARTDTRWFHQFIHGKAEVRFIKGRLKFGGSKNSAPFPSMVVIFKS